MPPEIEIMNSDGSNRATLTTGKQPSWSPDGTKIVLSDNAEIYVINADGSNRTGLTYIPADGSDPSCLFTLPPIMDPITEPQGKYYASAPVLSHLGFDDDAALDNSWYQFDSTSGDWITLFTDAPGTSWDSDNWAIPGFDALDEGSHTIYFKASDDDGNVAGDSGEWSWQFYKVVPDHITVTPSKAFLPLSGTKQFSATAYDQYNNRIEGLSFDWSVVNGGGIDADGLFTAGDIWGTFTDTVQAQASYGGNTSQGTATAVIGYTLTATATLQGGDRPLAGMNIPLTIKLYDQATTLDSGNILSASPLHTFARTEGAINITNTDTGTRTITFQVFGLPVGTFNIALCSPHCLINLKNGVELTAQRTSLNLGTLLDGNADESVQIAGADFSLLLNDYLQVTGGPRWNGGRCDFDRSEQVDSVDFSLMINNYNKTSPQILP